MSNTNNFFTDNSVISTASGNLSFTTNEGGNTISLTHLGGSNIQFGNLTTSMFNSNNSQVMTMGSVFDTSYGTRSLYTGGAYDLRIEGSYTDIVGASALIKNDLLGEWFNAYNEVAALKGIWRDDRESLPEEAYPLNTALDAPENIEKITVCPPLIDGTAENNKNDQTRADLEKAMMDPITIGNIEATKELVTKLTDTYSDIKKNLQSLYKSFYPSLTK